MLTHGGSGALGPGFQPLEAEARAELARERFGNDHARGSNESGRLFKRAGTDIAAVAGAEIGAIGQVEGLEKQLQLGPVLES